MKERSPKTSDDAQFPKMSDHLRAVGTVSRDMVTQRARELAMINGRAHFTEDDWLAAKRELTGADTEFPEEESIATLTRWDEEPGSSGHHVPNQEPPDEQVMAEHLVEDGVKEAEHDQMVEGSRPRNE